MRTIFPDEGLPTLALNQVVIDVKLKLFTNNIVPDRNTVEADLTEAAWAGYAGEVYSQAEWTNTGMIGHTAFVATPPNTFLNTSGGDVDAYGWYLVDNATETILLAAARFDPAPETLVALTGELDVTPVVGCFSEQE